MIPVEVAYKDVIDAVEVGLKPHELHLGSFATVYQEMPVLDLYQLCRGKPAEGRKRATGTEYGDTETQDWMLDS
jgi:hypothetical protein